MATIAANVKPLPKRNPHFWRDTIQGYLFIMPVVLGLIIFTIGPMIASAYYSLTDYNIMSEPEFVAFDNYIKLFTRDRDFARSIGVTLRFAIASMAIGQVVSLGVATLLTQKVRGMYLFRTFFYLPIIVPFVASALLFKYLFNAQFGPVNAILEMFGIQGVNWLGSQDWAQVAMVLIAVWTGGVVTTIFYVAGLQQVPEELYDSSKIDGASAWQRFLRITLPMLTPTIFFNVVTGFIGAFQFFVPAFIITEGGPSKATYFYNLNLYDKAFNWFEMGYASSMAWVLFIFVLILTLMIFRSSPLWVYYEGEVKQ